MQSRCLADQNQVFEARHLALEARQELQSALQSHVVQTPDPQMADCLFLLAFALEACGCFDEAKNTLEEAFLLPAHETLAHLQIVLNVIQKGISLGKQDAATALAGEARKRRVETWGIATSTNDFVEQHFSLLRCYRSLTFGSLAFCIVANTGLCFRVWQEYASIVYS